MRPGGTGPRWTGWPRSRRAALALAALLAVAGCAPDPGPPAPAPSGGPLPAPPAVSAPAPADLPFLRAMVAHHDRTRVIAAAATGRITDAELRTLVAAVDVTEADELATMRRWLAAAPHGDAPGSPGHHPHHDTHDTSDAQGASATPDAPATADPDLARLRAAPPGRFDAVLVEVLTAHQRAAVALARRHLPAAVGPEVRALADRVARSRAAQIRLMAGLPAA
ncbi:DUF305 domain-containing protein [Micromonospora carbonacea subsp. aurantiaca]|uniref:DUF305 domain-containing protein n=1 Tax=Micromonospora carbonacea TaxID=47853 RepID=A0A7H8XVC3_9ACTN|nr:DUF305 domain-containing protein [Micromonospora carbonacea]